MKVLDLLIVGAGINGAGIAQRAAAAGYSVMLLDKSTIAAGTSSQSSKLIHGGLRYLESGQLPLVYEALKARRELLQLAPSLVHPVKFYIPIYRDSRRSAFTIRAGLSLYGMLSQPDPLGRFQSIPAQAWTQFPGLKLAGMTHLFQYWDAQTDDKRLTEAVVASAAALGAEVWQHSECTAIQHDAKGCLVQYQQHGVAHEVYCHMLVNTTGAWVNELLARVQPALTAPAIEWVQGSHLLLDLPAPPGILYLESCFDERVVFVMPWHGKTLLGTTETHCDTPEPQLTKEETYYLLGIYCHYFPLAGGTDTLESKIISSFSGMRVLPCGSSSAFSRTREVQFLSQPSHPHILSLYGGKLTTFRSTAKQALLRIEQQLGRRQWVADVDNLQLG
ncbi:glycerol-3-phosphate dehydrogenase/oxidase [Shewanella dokdonensis]|uniref:glycerol-3-phosphate dehydrogenase/oxidase n=1 Tax=Shewanella dokdonensis TaxID=712036 RepID=UPI00200E4A85|nr:FAD-dependent oxidoreductase [Shewanella dokdonensis]MCL1074618.1 FAD-dependent oxidoreductase [Shewanella dokdonensis]